jgi:tetratricopeptide (TPR) repeat protein
MTGALDDCWDYADPAGSEERLRAWLTDHAGDVVQAAEARTQVARALVLQRRFREGHAELDLVEAVLADLPDRVRARYHLERGRTQRDEGDEDAACVAFHAAWRDAESDGDEGLAVDAAHMIALVTQLEEAERWVELAVARARSAAEPRVRRWAFTLAKNHAHRVLESGRPEESLPWLDRAEEAADSFERFDLKRSVSCGRARAWRLLGRLEDAEELARETLAASDTGERVIGFLHEELGEILYARGDVEAAAPHLRAAVEAHEKDPWFGPTEAERLERLRRLLEG